MCGVNWFPKGTLLRSWLTKSRPRLLLLIAGLKRPQNLQPHGPFHLRLQEKVSSWGTPDVLHGPLAARSQEPDSLDEISALVLTGL
ncbi:unnamed protein product [Gadus morhua 'NCC']